MAAAAFAIVTLVFASPALGQAVIPPVALSVVADNTLSIPGGTGTFTSFNPNLPGLPPAPGVSDGSIAFWGAGSGGQQGIYTIIWQSQPAKVADLTTAIPGGTGDFVSFPASPQISGNNVALWGYGSGGQDGVYALIGGSPLSKVTDLTTAIPGGAGNFTEYPPNPLISGANVAFIGNGGSGQQGVYVSIPTNSVFPPTPIKVANTGTAIPGGTGDFVSYPPSPCISGANVAFIGNGGSGEQGMYISIPSNSVYPPTPVKVANQSTVIPGFTTDTFTQFSAVSVDGVNVAFVGDELSNTDVPAIIWQGVYLSAPTNSVYPPSPLIIADFNTPVPGESSASFFSFGSVAVDPNNVVFAATSQIIPPCQGGVCPPPVLMKGIYGYVGGSLVKIIDQNDTPNGKAISDLNFGPGGFSGNQVVFEVEFTDGSSSIMTGTFTDFIRCPLSQGFWKNHPSAWPVTTLVLGNQTYSKNQLLALLGTSSTSDASLVLARQLIAAKLNIANFSDPSPANASIADADGRLSTFNEKLPYGVKSGTSIGTGMLHDAGVLQNYNTDQLTAGCIP